MRKFYFLSTLVLTILMYGSTVNSQDFSNKGKDFWVAYGYHQVMTASNGQEMVLYFAADTTNTNVTVSIPGTGYSQNYFVAANTVVTSNPIPKAGVLDARLKAESTSPENKGIHITSDKPIVAYAHIYNQSVSGASILFPTLTLGREYFSINYTNISNSPNSNCWFYVVAADTGTTTVEITPSAATINHAAGVPFTVALTQGQVYNIMGQYTGNTGVDLTGSKIQSINTGSGCKKIAVFSGSGRISITCDGNSSSSDNYMVQAFPKSAWGKKYLTVATGGNQSNNIYRICVSDPATVVTLNGGPIGVPLINGFYYELPVSSTPKLIEADKPVMVAQYLTSQGACGNGAQPGDPEVIYLSSVEQNISKVLWNATPNFAILQHYFNVIIPNTGNAISSFRLDGASIPPASFITHPQAPGYSYLVKSVTAGQHTITSDSGFNAIAYGYGNAESYGYNAGTNIKDIFQYISVQNEYGTVNFPATCRNAPFYFSMTFPYQPTQIKWQFGALLNSMGFANVTIDNGGLPLPPTSTKVVAGKTLYVYQLPLPYTISAAGTYPIRLVASNPTPDGCSGLQEIDFDVQVYEPPVADFNFTTGGCFTSPVQFTDNSNTSGRAVISRYWNFADAATSTINNPAHTYTAPGSYDVKYTLITDIGCIADTTIHRVTVNPLPTATISGNTFVCLNATSPNITFTGTSGNAPFTFTYKINGGLDQTITTTSGNSVTLPVPTGTAGTFIYSLVKVSIGTTSVCEQLQTGSVTVTVKPLPTASISGTTLVCLNSASPIITFTGANGTAPYTFTYKINGGADQTVTTTGGNTATVTVPTNTAGVFTYSLVSVKEGSTNFCSQSQTGNAVITVNSLPTATLTTGTNEVCLNASSPIVTFMGAGGVAPYTFAYNINGGANQSISTTTGNSVSVPVPTGTAGTFTYSLISVKESSAAQCSQLQPGSVSIIVNTLPSVNFNFSNPGCEFSIISFNDISVSNGGVINNWQWNFDDPGSGAANTSNLQNPNHTFTSARTYNVSLIVTTNKGCVSTVFSKPVIINAKPIAGFISPEICLSDPSASFADTSKVAIGNIVAWNWNFGDPNATVANPNTSTLQNPTHKYLIIGSYTSELIITTDIGCKDTIQQTFTVNGSIPVSGFSVQNANALCSNKDVTITDASTVDFGNIVKVEIYWDYLNNPAIKSTDDIPLSGKIYSHTYPEFPGPPFSTIYRIRYVAYSGINCVDTKDIDIIVLATPDLQFTSIPYVCSDAPSFQLTQTQLLNGLPGSGFFSGPGVNSTGLFTPSVAGAGAHSIRYTFTGVNGCSNFKEQTINVYQAPPVNAGPDKVVLEGGQVTLTPAINIGEPVTYLWSPPTGLADPTIEFAIASPPDDITYTLTVTTDKGCTNSDQVFVKVLKAPTIPNIFSPNGDGVHDKWILQYLESYPGCTVDIYNRYGQLIFHSVGYTRPWDGTINGKPVPIGTYYYIVNPKNGRKQLSGYVDVIR